MPTITRVCAWATCQRIATQGRYCDEHHQSHLQRRADHSYYDRKQTDRDYNAGRTELEAFYGRKAWKSARADVLRTEPLCRMCQAKGLTVSAVLVDHIIPLKQRPDLALERNNLQPLCRACHDAKTRTDLSQQKG